MRTNDIIRFAHELKAEFNTDNPFTLAQYYGFRVCLTSGNPDVFKAHTVKLDGYPTIISINQAFSHTGKVFLCAHELGHALLHNNSINHFDPSGRGITTSDYEYEANLFAVALLVDEQKLNMPLRHMSNAVLKRIIDYNLFISIRQPKTPAYRPAYGSFGIYYIIRSDFIPRLSLRFP